MRKPQPPVFYYDPRDLDIYASVTALCLDVEPHLISDRAMVYDREGYRYAVRGVGVRRTGRTESGGFTEIDASVEPAFVPAELHGLLVDHVEFIGAERMGIGNIDLATLDLESLVLAVARRAGLEASE